MLVEQKWKLFTQIRIIIIIVYIKVEVNYTLCVTTIIDILGHRLSRVIQIPIVQLNAGVTIQGIVIDEIKIYV